MLLLGHFSLPGQIHITPVTVPGGVAFGEKRTCLLIALGQRAEVQQGCFLLADVIMERFAGHQLAVSPLGRKKRFWADSVGVRSGFSAFLGRSSGSPSEAARVR